MLTIERHRGGGLDVRQAAPVLAAQMMRGSTSAMVASKPRNFVLKQNWAGYTGPVSLEGLLQELSGLPHWGWAHQVVIDLPLGDLAVVHREFFAFFFGKEVHEVTVRTGPHGLAHDVVLLELVGCFPQGRRQRLIVGEFFARHGVGVAFFHALAWIQFAADAIDPGGQDGCRCQVWAGATVNTAVFYAATVWNPQHGGSVVAAVHDVGWCPGRPRGWVGYADALIGIDVGTNEGLHAAGVVEHAADEVVGGLRQTVAVIFIIENVVAVLVPQAEVGVQAVTGVAGEWFAHERWDNAVAFFISDRVCHVVGQDQPVGGGHRIGVVDVDFILPVTVFGVDSRVAPAHLVDVAGQFGQVGPGTFNTVGVVAGFDRG